MEKMDFKKQFKELYLPKGNGFAFVDVPEFRFVMVDGQGEPEGEAYTHAVQWLYSTVYPMKFIAKKELGKLLSCHHWKGCGGPTT